MTDQPPDLGAMIDKYREIEAMVDAAAEAFAAEWKPYKDGMAALKVAVGVELVRQKLQNSRGQDGLAYLKRGITPTVDNRETFLDFVVDNNRWDLLDAGVLVDPIKVMMVDDQGNYTKDPPPGVTVKPYVTCIIRK